MIFGSATKKVKKLLDKGDAEGLVKLLENDKARYLASEALLKLGETSTTPLIKCLTNKSVLASWAAAEVLTMLGWEPKSDEEAINSLAALQCWEELVDFGEKAISLILERVIFDRYRHSYTRHIHDVWFEYSFCSLLQKGWVSSDLTNTYTYTEAIAGIRFAREVGGEETRERFCELREMGYHILKDIFLFVIMMPAITLKNIGEASAHKIVERLQSYELYSNLYDTPIVGPLLWVLEEVGKELESKKDFMRNLGSQLENKSKKDPGWRDLIYFCSKIKEADYGKTKGSNHYKMKGKLVLSQNFTNVYREYTSFSNSFNEEKDISKKLKISSEMYKLGDRVKIFFMLEQLKKETADAIDMLGEVGDLRVLPYLVEIRQNSKSYDSAKRSIRAMMKITR